MLCWRRWRCPAIVHLLPLGDTDPMRRAFEEHAGGGAFGLFLSDGLVDALGVAAAVVLLVGGLFLGGLLLFDVTLGQVATWTSIALILSGRACWRLAQTIEARLTAPRLKVHRVGTPSPRPLAGTLAQVVRKARPIARAAVAPVEREPETLSLPPGPAPIGPNGVPAWRLPAIALFQAAAPVEMSQTDVRAQARMIEETLQSFNVQARVVEVSSGPTVTQFGLEPAPGVAVNRILARSNDLALRLGASALRLEAPVPGRRVVGIEVPNRIRPDRQPARAFRGRRVDEAAARNCGWRSAAT